MKYGAIFIFSVSMLLAATGNAGLGDEPFAENSNCNSGPTAKAPNAYSGEIKQNAIYFLIRSGMNSSKLGLNLSNYNLGDEYAKALAANFPPGLETLDLSANNIGAEGAKALALKLPSTLKTLNLSANNIGAGGAKAIAANFPPGLTVLNLFNNNIGAGGAKAIAANFPPDLKYLNLSNNKLGADGAKAIAANFPPGLKYLNLSNNKLGDTGIIEFAGFLPETLERLDLQGNQMGSNSASMIFANLPKDCENLDMSNNNIDDAAFIDIDKYLRDNNKGSKNILLSDNPIGYDGIKLLIEFVNNFEGTYIYVHVFPNKLTTEERNELMSSVKEKKRSSIRF